MPTKNPRIHVVLEKPLFERLRSLSIKEGLSMSLEAREIIRQALNSAESPTMKPFKGTHMKSLVGKFKMGQIDADDVLAKQVHG